MHWQEQEGLMSRKLVEPNEGSECAAKLRHVAVAARGMQMASGHQKFATYFPW